MRARPHAAAHPARSAAHTRSQWVSREPRRSPRGGGAGAAWQPPYGSVQPPPASGIGAAGSARPRPALQRVRTSRLLPPSLLRLPAPRALTAGEGLSREALRLGRGLKFLNFGWSQGLAAPAAASRTARWFFPRPLPPGIQTNGFPRLLRLLGRGGKSLGVREDYLAPGRASLEFGLRGRPQGPTPGATRHPSPCGLWACGAGRPSSAPRDAPRGSAFGQRGLNFVNHLNREG